MIKVKHPIDKYNDHQAEFIKNCLDQTKMRFHELMFCYGNAAYRYHKLADGYQPNETDFKEWLEALPDNIRLDMEKRGLEGCKTILPFTRYVNEKNNIGIDQFINNLMGEEYFEYKLMIKD